MLPNSVIDQELINAYRETEFRVHGSMPFILKIGIVSSNLIVAHKRHRVQSSAFLTACNPYSQSHSEEKNRELQIKLAKELTASRLDYIEGVGQHPSNNWDGEPSFLVFGLTLERAKSLGTQFQQNAIVWSDADGTPQLILLR